MCVKCGEDWLAVEGAGAHPPSSEEARARGKARTAREGSMLSLATHVSRIWQVRYGWYQGGKSAASLGAPSGVAPYLWGVGSA